MTPDSKADAIAEHATAKASRICVIDLGTNSFHALVVDIDEAGSVDIVDKLKLPVHLGDAGLQSGTLTHDAVDRATRALTQIVTLARRRQAQETLAYATSAIRDAANGPAFVSHIRSKLGLDIEVIDGRREASLIYLGVRRTLELDEPTLIVDIGGGSTEFVIADRDDMFEAVSMPLGAARLTELFISSDPLSESDRVALEDHLDEALAALLASCREHGVKAIVGSSGTMETLAELAMGKRDGRPEQHVFEPRDLERATGTLLGSTQDEREQSSAIDDRRVAQIVAGAVLLDFLVSRLDIEEFRLSPAAMREGMVSWWGDRANARAPVDVVMSRARELCVHHGGDLEHATQTARLALELFDALQPVHDLDEHDRRLLEIAAIVHDVGHSISGRRHHKHSRYIIEQAQWPGVSPVDVTVVSLVARYHRRALPKKKHRHFRALEKSDRARVEKLGAILRLADKLDRSHVGNTRAVEASVGNDQVFLTVETESDPRLELSAARTAGAAFARAFDYELVVHAAWRPPSHQLATVDLDRK